MYAMNAYMGAILWGCVMICLRAYCTHVWVCTNVANSIVIFVYMFFRYQIKFTHIPRAGNAFPMHEFIVRPVFIRNMFMFNRSAG